VKPTLGPSRSFLANVKLLEKVEGSVLTETVDLRKEGGIFWVDVSFNGKVTKPMAWDTGAADVVLPAEFAAEIGLRPGNDDPVVRCRVADGSIVEAKQMSVPSMRVGKFTIKDVACVVMPASKSNVPPLLGQSFQRNFSFKFSAEAAKLTLSRVESTEATRPAPRTKGATKSTTRGAAVKRPPGGDEPQ
jgi:clan AA aspartic protease (TIGR02281 family)